MRDWFPLGSSPTELCAVSGKPLFWALLMLILERNGPSRQELKSFNSIGIGDLCDLTGHDQPGDLIAVHLLIETLVAQVAASLDVQPPSIEKFSSQTQRFTRRLGGLRKESFLRDYSALAWAAGTVVRAHLDAQEWLSAANTLIEHSPLTQLVYADIVQVPLDHQRWQGLGRATERNEG